MKNSNQPRTPSDAKINANRENAKKSTGPRTDAGKDASSRNHLIHGLRANKHILLDEDPAEFLLLLDDHLDRFQPVGPNEESLVLRMAHDRWRLNRAFGYEEGIYRDRFHDVARKDENRQDHYAVQKDYAKQDGDPEPPPPTPPDERDLLARAFAVDCDYSNTFAKLARYETSIEHSIDRCHRQLERYQAMRNPAAPDPGPEPDSPSAPAAPTPETEPETPETSAPTPPESTNYRSNPKNGGIAFFLMLYALLHAVPELIAALTSLLTAPKIGTSYPRTPSLSGQASGQTRWGDPLCHANHPPRPPKGRQTSPPSARLSKHRAIV